MSRQAGLWVALAVLAAGIAGCASGASKASADMRQLQARAAYERGLQHLRDKQPGLALGALQQAVTTDDSVAVYWNTLGWLNLQLGRFDEALPKFRKAVELDPAFAEAQLNIGVVLAETASWEEAASAYRKAIALPTLSTPHVAYQNLGLAYYHLKRYREAEEALRFAITLDPQLAPAFYHLGLVFTVQNRSDDAKAAFRRARDLAPQTPFGQAAIQRLQALGDGG